MELKSEVARDQKTDAVHKIERELGVALHSAADAVFIDAGRSVAAGVDGLKFRAPVTSRLLAEAPLFSLFEAAFAKGQSVLIRRENEGFCVLCGREGHAETVMPDDAQAERIRVLLAQAGSWGGTLNADGELISDLKSPQPGPNYYTNLLIGNRVGFPRPLQSTPKSVVDRLGRGSFRSHADTQVLATRWDYLPEENGFPANRQFYLVENGSVLFYSADPGDPNITAATCTHGQNRTVITYETACGLRIRRTLFILPQEEGLPLATEVQVIEIENTGGTQRNLRLVYTGMFGTGAAHALKEDIIYSTVICQSRVFYTPGGAIAGVSYDFNPAWEKGNIRFHSTVAHQGDAVIYPDQFCFSYSDFIGSGTLEHPAGAACLNNRHTRRGPGFFALSVPLCVRAKSTVTLDNFTGLVSDALDPAYDEESLPHALSELLTRYSRAGETHKALERVCAFAQEYASFLTVNTPDAALKSYLNRNLPFQVFYQTFVSRSFDQTQKGYREIGFREIQDIFASMYYLEAMGQRDFLKQLLREWIGNVHGMGYANHNFYWQGKQPGLYSDDALWLVQALDRYLNLTGDADFLKEKCSVADGGERTVLETVRAVISYSAKISVGGHGLPLMDQADWNDCLRVDPDHLDGPAKERAYHEQIARGGKYGDAFESEFSESVMNGFLLKCAVDAAQGMAFSCGEEDLALEFKTLGTNLRERLRRECWKGDFFARVLFNRSAKPWLQYLGAKGDGLAIEPGSEGTYFLNSFSWAVLSDTADEEQIGIMLDTIDRHLKTPYGYRLCTGADYPKIAPRIDVALYFPGDRENGAVFKHANMMAAAAMLRAAGTVKDSGLAARLTRSAYWIIDIVLPFRTLSSPYEICGNPRFCTQYNNSETGENIGPTLSGTSTWLLLSFLSAFGLTFSKGAIRFEPLLREEETSLHFRIKMRGTIYNVSIEKPRGFRRTADGFRLTVDGEDKADPVICLSGDGGVHSVIMRFC